MDFEDLEREIDEPPPKVTGYPVAGLDKDKVALDRYADSCMEDRHMGLVNDYC